MIAIIWTEKRTIESSVKGREVASDMQTTGQLESVDNPHRSARGVQRSDSFFLYWLRTIFPSAPDLILPISQRPDYLASEQVRERRIGAASWPDTLFCAEPLTVSAWPHLLLFAYGLIRWISSFHRNPRMRFREKLFKLGASCDSRIDRFHPAAGEKGAQLFATDNDPLQS